MLLLLAPVLAGCFDNTYVKQDRADRREKVLRLTDHVGGAHECMVVNNRVWYVGQGPRLLVLEGRGGKPVKVEQAGPVGGTASVADLVMWRGDLVGVIDGDAVVRWDLSNPRSPALIDRVDAKALGIRPRCLTVLGNELFIGGNGGVVRASDGRRFLPEAKDTGEVVTTSEGLACVSGRRVLRLEDGRFIGAASMLLPLPKDAGIPGGFAFLLQTKDGATVGTMGPDVRERSGQVVRGVYSRMRFAGGRLWIIGDGELATWLVRDGKLEDPIYAKVKGARDLSELTDNLFAMVGSFGRAVYHLRDDKEGSGDEFTDVQREPGRLERSIFDGRRVLAGSAEGVWLYPIRGKPTLSDKSVELTQLPETKVTLTWGTVTIDKGDGKPETPDELRAVVVDGPDGKARWSPPNGAWISTVVPVGADVWVGHAEGITVLRHVAVPVEPEDAATKGANAKTDAKTDAKSDADTPKPALMLQEVGSLRLPGPIIWLHPLRTGNGVAWVSRFGGMGVAELLPDGEAPAKSTAASASPSSS
jgi:hypothetical protein